MITEKDITTTYEGCVQVTVIDCSAIMAEIEADNQSPPSKKIYLNSLDSCLENYQYYGDILKDINLSTKMMVVNNTSCCGTQWTLEDLVSRVRVDPCIRDLVYDIEVSIEMIAVLSVLVYEGNFFPSGLAKGLFSDAADVIISSPSVARAVTMISESFDVLSQFQFDLHSCDCHLETSEILVASTIEALTVKKWPHNRKHDYDNELKFAPSYRVGETDLMVTHADCIDEPLHQNAHVSNFIYLSEVLTDVSDVETVICIGAFDAPGIYAAAAAFPNVRFYLTDVKVSQRVQEEVPLNCIWFQDIHSISYSSHTTLLFDNSSSMVGKPRYRYVQQILARYNSVKFQPPPTIEKSPVVIGGRIDTLHYQSTSSRKTREFIDRGVGLQPLTFYDINVPSYYDFMFYYNSEVRKSCAPIPNFLTSCTCADCFGFMQATRIACVHIENSSDDVSEFVNYFNRMQNCRLYSVLPTSIYTTDCFGSEFATFKPSPPLAFLGGTVKLFNVDGYVDVYCPPYVYTPASESIMVKVNGFRETYLLSPARDYVFGNGIGSIPIGLYFHVRSVLGISPPVIHDGGYRVAAIDNIIPHDPGPHTLSMF